MEDTKDLKKKYFDYVNHTLPKDLLPGFVEAMKLYKDIYDIENYDEDEDEPPAVCVVIDVPNSCLSFAVGDGLELEGPDDEAIFYKFNCDKIAMCAAWIEETQMNLGHETAHWLDDSTKLATKEGVFKEFPIFVLYGDNEYGSGDFDPFYEAFGDDED